MSTSLAHPFRLAGGGRIATVDQGSASHASQLAGHVLSTTPGERPLAPLFGLSDQVGGQIDIPAVYAALALSCPEVRADGVDVTDNLNGTVDIGITVSWAEE